MNTGLSGESFGYLLLLMTGVYLAVGLSIFFIARKQGVNITSRRFVLITSLSCGLIFIIIPFWLTDLALQHKIIGTVFMLFVSLCNYIVIDRLAKALRARVDKRKCK
ncbi:MAG TPA: hypothetical protein PKM17_13620 [Syntrophorhabdus sp.]|nr:hypothetical protein [Syntrophorhabdus sp.]